MIDKPGLDFKSHAIAVAKAAGLDDVIRRFPEDLLAAASAAARDLNDMPALDEAKSEPWPPMFIKAES